MKNKVELKKFLSKIFIIFLLFLISLIILNIYEYQEYTKNFNNKIDNIIFILHENYPNITEEEIIDVLNNKESTSSNILKKYGINLNNKSIVLKNEKQYHSILILNVLIILTFLSIILILLFKYLKTRHKNIQEITKYLEEINKKNYSLHINSNSEDELSILKNEIYKTTIMLKETAEISKNDKLNLKTSLEDISHQLKTPLTSILVMLDNLIDDPDMEAATKEDFLKDIKRNVTNINFLVQSILKLSKFDANTIKFIKKENYLQEIIKDATKNVSTLCDLKNIKLNIKGENQAKISCDFMWQVEALTNIIKNCVEHSFENSQIDISHTQNKVYAEIIIKDYGSGISKKELPHIFERFYKGENSSADSIGIGLALAKTIIEKDNGTINVTSNQNGTTFIIKYYNF